jgi:Protein of unknown function (DUF2384)
MSSIHIGTKRMPTMLNGKEANDTMNQIIAKQITDEQHQAIFDRTVICRKLGVDMATRVYAEDVEALLRHIAHLEHLAQAERLQCFSAGQVIDHAVVALDGRANAMRWLDAPHPQLSDRRPLQLLCSAKPYDVQRVDDLLSELELEKERMPSATLLRTTGESSETT